MPDWPPIRVFTRIDNAWPAVAVVKMTRPQRLTVIRPHVPHRHLSPCPHRRGSGVWKQVPHTSEPQPLDQVPSFVLGSNTVSPLGMAEAFAMFANRGEHCESFAVEKVEDRNGETLVEREPECNHVLDEDVADMVNDVLEGVVSNEGATGSAMRLDDGRPAVGKTGTTNENVAVWFVGYTPQISAAAAVADLEAPQETLSGREFNGEVVPQAFGGNLPGPMWREAMNEALEDEPEEDFPEPDDDDDDDNDGGEDEDDD